VHSVLSTIRAQRAQLNQTQNAIDGLDAGMSRGFAEAQGTNPAAACRADIVRQRRRRHQFDGQHARWPRQITPQRRGDAKRHCDAGLLHDLKALRDQCGAWNHEYVAAQTDLVDRKKAVDASVLAIRAALSSAEGRERLALAAKVRRFHKLSGEPAQKAAEEMIGQLGSTQQITEIPVEVSNLALLSERLAGEEQIDHLADLKDNQFTPSLFRLTQLLSNENGSHPELVRDMNQHLGDFEQAVFGSGYVIDAAHQTLNPGADGLYSLCRQRLELRQRRELLRAQLQKQATEYKAAYERLDTISGVMKDAITSQAEKSLGRGWRNLLLTSIACAALLALLGMKVAAVIERQFTLIAEATCDLAQKQRPDGGDSSRFAGLRVRDKFGMENPRAESIGTARLQVRPEAGLWPQTGRVCATDCFWRSRVCGGQEDRSDSAAPGRQPLSR
jgi:hypothetical protein